MKTCCIKDDPSSKTAHLLFPLNNLTDMILNRTDIRNLLMSAIPVLNRAKKDAAVDKGFDSSGRCIGLSIDTSYSRGRTNNPLTTAIMDSFQETSNPCCWKH